MALSRTLDKLLAEVSMKDRLILMALSNEYLQSVVVHNRIILSMWAHPDSWGPEWREGADFLSQEMAALQTVLKAEFTRVFGASAEVVRSQVFAFLTGRFDV